MTESEARAEARALRRSIARLTRGFRATRDVDGPTPAQLSVLGTLYRNGPTATGELAQLERLKPQSVTRLVAALSAHGLIERIVDEADRRRLVLAITAQGRHELAREMQRRDIGLGRRLALLTADECALLRAARILIDRLADSDEQPAVQSAQAVGAASPSSRSLFQDAAFGGRSMTPDNPDRLDITKAQLRNSRFLDVDLSAVGFRDVRLAGAMFGDVDLSTATFEDVNLRMACFADVDFTGATIVTSTLTGMRINGVLVSELFEAYGSSRR